MAINKRYVVPVIEEARDIIDKGWCRGQMVKPGEKFCTVGAIAAASGLVVTVDKEYGDRILSPRGDDVYTNPKAKKTPEYRRFTNTVKLLANYLPDYDQGWDDPEDTLIGWNDSRKSRKQVIKLFDAALEDLKG